MENPYGYAIRTMTKNQLERWYKEVDHMIGLTNNYQLKEDVGKLLLKAVLQDKVHVVIEYNWFGGEDCAAALEECCETTRYVTKSEDPRIEFLRSQGYSAIFAPHFPHDFRMVGDYGLVGFITEDGRPHVFKED